MDSSFWFTVALVLATLLVSVIVVLRFMLWPLYARTRDERDEFEARLGAVMRDREGWRTVAERALLVAQIGRNVTQRAADVATVTKRIER